MLCNAETYQMSWEQSAAAVWNEPNTGCIKYKYFESQIWIVPGIHGSV